jgi:hypothetical protein
MQIPESIAKITTEVKADKFNFKSELSPLNVEEILLQIKRTLDTKSLGSFETGLIYFKSNPTSDKVVIKNLLFLLLDQVLKAIKESAILEEEKPVITSSVKKLFESLTENVDAIFSILSTLNKNNNLLDVKDITFIILGYAIGLIKKIYNS